MQKREFFQVVRSLIQPTRRESNGNATRIITAGDKSISGPYGPKWLRAVVLTMKQVNLTQQSALTQNNQGTDIPYTFFLG